MQASPEVFTFAGLFGTNVVKSGTNVKVWFLEQNSKTILKFGYGTILCLASYF
ncbi:MAG: hypothetical protein K0S32_1850 [Bacteroidetes bacterium]|jgi:hypothetical protein|nr:hypothetical protein [Bacteroidota bacterium]